MPSPLYKLIKPVVLVGMMGAGKTAVGGALAHLLGARFRDTDVELVKAATMSIHEIFERDGEAFFRRRESEVLTRLLEGPPCVISTGGGAFMSESNRDLISQMGMSVWLKADVDLLWSRVSHKTTRPLLLTDDPYGTLKSLCETRDPVYAQADLSVQARETYSITDMAEAVMTVMAEEEGMLQVRA